MPKPKILIRADASSAIGTGHVMRCLALAQAWRDAGGCASLMAAGLPDRLSVRLKNNQIGVVTSEATPGSPEDARALIAYAAQQRADWIVIDGDRFGCDYLESVCAAGCPVMLIDDYADREAFSAKMIVNLNFGADSASYRRRGFQGEVLTGPGYALLRREFQRPFDWNFETKGNRVLVTLGGSDPENLTPQVVMALATCPDLQLTVALGPASSVTSPLEGNGGADVRVVVDASNMAELMMEADVAITVAGGTLWELMCCGCPVLCYTRTAGGSHVVNCLAKQGVIVDMGDVVRFDRATIVSAVREIVDSISARERMASQGRALVDGLGARRVVQALRSFDARRAAMIS